MNIPDKTAVAAHSFFIKPGYRSREEPHYFEDTLAESSGIVHQPDVYAFAAYLGKIYGCTHIIDVGCGHAQKLMPLNKDFQCIGIDFGSNIDFCRSHYSTGTWIEHDFENEATISIDGEILKKSVIVCSDVIEHLKNPSMLLRNLHRFMEDAPVGILTTPERDLVRGEHDIGPPPNQSHVREWNIDELTNFLSHAGFHLPFIGLTFNNNQDLQKKTIAAIIQNNNVEEFFSAPSDFKVTAIMTAYNEEDIILPSIRRLIDQGIEVYLIDNWSTDATYDLAKQYLGKGVCGMERFPNDGPSKHYEWNNLLARVEKVSRTLDAHWIIHHDADEVRTSPWQNVSLKNGIFNVDQSGFNAIDHTVITFRPVDNNYHPGTSFEENFKYFEFGKRDGHFHQIKAWKKTISNVRLAATGGHEAQFEHRLVYPYKFLLKHYPIRSQAHGERKIFLERQPRWSPGERAKGWHTHYDEMRPGHNFLSRPDDLACFDETAFYSHYLFERLSGVGIVRPK